MRRVGQRDDAGLETGSEAGEEFTDGSDFKAFDFSTEPVFADDAAPTRADVPGRPGEYFEIRALTDGECKGRSRFYKAQSATRTERGVKTETVHTSVDAEGLALYIRGLAITDFRIKRGGKDVVRDPRNAAANQAVYKSIGGRFAEWLDGEISLVNGWGQEAAAERERFPEEAA